MIRPCLAHGQSPFRIFWKGGVPFQNIRAKDGDKVIFIEENGRIIMENATMVALKNAQDAFAGEAERLGLKTEQDVVDLVKEVRREI